MQCFLPTPVNLTTFGEHIVLDEFLYRATGTLPLLNYRKVQFYGSLKETETRKLFSANL